MKDLILAKVDLPPDWIPAAVGEPFLIKDNLLKSFGIGPLLIKEVSDFEYTKPQGYEPLVKFLEDKHQAPVIIANGAKQAIGSLFFALKQKKIKDIYMKTPWWSLFPPLIKMHSLKQAFHPFGSKTAELLVSPNNPDGKLNFDCEEQNYCIHDAAYYNYACLPRSENLINFGDVQVFTCSKLWGLSQLRIGYSVFHNMDLYQSTLQYMENMTVGVSVLSQIFALNIFKIMKENPIYLNEFENKCFEELSHNRLLVNNIHSSILEIDPSQRGMFLWAKCHNLNIFNEAKISVVEGSPFGMPGFIRMNLALPTEQITEIVKRLNNYVF